MLARNRTVSPDLYESPPLVTDNAPTVYPPPPQIPCNLSVLASPSLSSSFNDYYTLGDQPPLCRRMKLDFSTRND